MKFEKTKQWKTDRIKTADNRNRKREERLASKMKPNNKNKN